MSTPPPPRAPRGRRRPPAFPSSPTPWAALLSSPQLRGVPREPRGLCACRWRWGLLGGGRGGVCCRCRVAVAVRVGRWGTSGCGGACAPLALSRLWRPAELPGPPVAGGGGCRVGVCLEVASVPSVPTPRATSGCPRRRPRARLAPLSPPPPTSFPPFLQVPSAFRRGGLKTPGGTACPPRGRGGGPAGGAGGSRPVCPPPDSAPPCPGRGGGAALTLAPCSLSRRLPSGKGHLTRRWCRAARGVRGGVSPRPRPVPCRGWGGSPLGACGAVCVLAPRRGGGGGGWRRARPVSNPPTPL